MAWFKGKTPSVAEEMKNAYREVMLPLEERHAFHDFYSQELVDAQFESRPKVLLLGQYSAGKTTFIRHMLGCNHSCLRVGPEPVTDKFTVLTFNSAGDYENRIPGATLVLDQSLPFTPLSTFGNKFLSRLECIKLPSQILKSLTLIDTPGVGGELYQTEEFSDIIRWFIRNSDMVLVFFDSMRLDIPDELGRIMREVGKETVQKMHIVLNKSDYMGPTDLYRVSTNFMWKLGRLLSAVDIMPSLYTGSFWDEPLKHREHLPLFQMYENDLYEQLALLSHNADADMLQELVKRARAVRVHAFLMDALRHKVSGWLGGPNQQMVLSKLHDIKTELIQDKEKKLSDGDFPELSVMRGKLSKPGVLFSKFQKLDTRLMSRVDKLIEEGFPQLQDRISRRVPLELNGAQIAPRRRAEVVARSSERSRSPRERASGSIVPQTA